MTPRPKLLSPLQPPLSLRFKGPVPLGVKRGPGRPLRSLRLPQGVNKSCKVGPGSRLSRGQPPALVLSSPPAGLEPHPPTQPRPQAQRPLSSEASFPGFPK